MLSVNLIYGTYGESGILTSIENTKRMLKLLEPEGVRSYKNAFKICDVLHAHTFGPIAVLLVLFHKALNKAVILHAHTTPQDVKDSYFAANLISVCLKGYLHLYYNLADVCIVPSAHTKDVLKTTLKVKRRIEVISNGIDTSLYVCNENRASEFKVEYALDDRPVVLSVGLVFLRKGILDFITVAKRNPHFQFVWAGRIVTWPFFPRAARKAIASTPKNVLFTGRVRSICQALSAADVFVFPSYEENQGIAVLEAAACGLPLILRDLPVYSDFVDGQNCVKFTAPDGFERAIRELLTHKKVAKTLGENAQKTAQIHDVHVLSKKLLQVYQTAKRA
ncbi:MAG: glycosyltransferase family 4 protein [Euryarchaeota archaeon]|nr:glycosyltransferase family 4 protein [Euryarchaeota archaeon]